MPEVTIDKRHYEIDGILFDKDGTLLDFAELWLHWARQWMNNLIEDVQEVELDVSVLGSTIGLDLDQNMWDPAGPLAIGSMDDLDTLLSFCLYEKGIPWNEATAIVVHNRESADTSIKLEDCLKPIKGLTTFLDQLHSASIPLGVVTSDDTGRARDHLDGLGISDYFGCVIGHDAVQRGKPFPDMALKACEQLQIQPEKTLIVGDSNGDMVTGKNANLLAGIGIVSNEIQTSSHLKEADHLIRNYKNSKVLPKKEEDN
ncbi:HAD family hydrolase [Virgibacillus sp. MSP4-1]|uniref:HAD family hydrolase n=1 Tax=Virgibacillus sp. MSP4-1 TaxID=2700081 RepID=UPI00039A07C5|nr:HAD family hydrolase [Virgibacillus sp. MSP4-1]QHS23785.1 HAD family hydrolase [Virgibacillus sp. MSP4-1]